MTKPVFVSESEFVYTLAYQADPAAVAALAKANGVTLMVVGGVTPSEAAAAFAALTA